MAATNGIGTAAAEQSDRREDSRSSLAWTALEAAGPSRLAAARIVIHDRAERARCGPSVTERQRRIFQIHAELRLVG